MASSQGGFGVISLALGISFSPRALGGLPGLLCGDGVMLAGKRHGLLLSGVPVAEHCYFGRGADIPAGQVAAALVGSIEAVNAAIGMDHQACDAAAGQRLGQRGGDAMMMGCVVRARLSQCPALMAGRSRLSSHGMGLLHRHGRFSER